LSVSEIPNLGLRIAWIARPVESSAIAAQHAAAQQQRCGRAWVRPERCEGQMQYRGIAFDIKVSITGEWIWIVHTPKPRQGACTGPRQQAVLLAKRAIDAWCHSHPPDCDNEVGANQD
jgi:hypothetical protein